MLNLHQRAQHELVKDGFLLVDKPEGILSHRVSEIIGDLLGVKAGHSGTLDPNVGGLLIVGLGRATKLLGFLSEQPKTYLCRVLFKDRVSKEEAESLLFSFLGEIEQTPPEKSAVARRPRKRRIYYIKMLEHKGREVLFEARVEKGTYMRVLCSDMGGQMLYLRRVESACLSVEDAVKFNDFSDFEGEKRKEGLKESIIKNIKSPEEVFWKCCLPKVVVSHKATEQIVRGAPLYFPGVLSIVGKVGRNSYVSLFCEDGRFIGVGKAVKEAGTKELEMKKKGIFLRVKRVHLNSL